ncbi:hypothetical protein E2C01_047193 [Portunus trituberculatus]|uniref:Uncharacterized protein n=1 Tax=Portunus trituberculatus TaxID=210409 RepID=A0A5B7G9T1_PORTR|nr:hypothetical protein [Portunus trituberculatus]
MDSESVRFSGMGLEGHHFVRQGSEENKTDEIVGTHLMPGTEIHTHKHTRGQPIERDTHG